MKPDDIISYHDLVHAEKATVQKGMNYDLGKGYSVLLMSVRLPVTTEFLPRMHTYEREDTPPSEL